MGKSYIHMVLPYFVDGSCYLCAVIEIATSMYTLHGIP